MMKQLLLMAGILLMATVAGAQVYVDGVNMNADDRVQYIEVVHSAYPDLFAVESIDLGTMHKSTSRFTDKSGKRLVINSAIQLEQLFKNNGWTLVRRDMVFKSKHDGAGGTLVFMLWEKKKG